LIRVVSAIHLDDEGRFLAEEVDDAGSDGMLSAELRLHDLPAAQHASARRVCLARVRNKRRN
jgi:hypothetical protein